MTRTTLVNRHHPDMAPVKRPQPEHLGQLVTLRLRTPDRSQTCALTGPLVGYEYDTQFGNVQLTLTVQFGSKLVAVDLSEESVVGLLLPGLPDDESAPSAEGA